MPYFLLLPLFVVWTVLFCAATIACLAVPGWRAASPYAWRSLVGWTLGFVVGNALAVVPAVLLLLPVEKLEDPSQLVKAFGWFLMLWIAFLGPVAGSGLGLSLGLYAGFRRAHTVLRRRPPAAATPERLRSASQST